MGEQARQVDLRRFALLASMQEVVWGSATMRFVFEPRPPVERLIANVRCACFIDQSVLLIDTAEFGLSAFPGGGLEPGEDWMHALERELLEEVGARPRSSVVVGRLRFWSDPKGPYRAHIPHPHFHQIVVCCQVELVGVPTNPPGGEHIVSVTRLPVDAAIERLTPTNPYEAELLAFVAEAGSRQAAGWCRGTAREPGRGHDPPHGYLCSGKTTFARRLEVRLGGVRYSLDEWATSLTHDPVRLDDELTSASTTSQCARGRGSPISAMT